MITWTAWKWHKREHWSPTMFFSFGTLHEVEVCHIPIKIKYALCMQKNKIKKYHFALINTPGVHHVVGWDFTMHLQQQAYTYIMHMSLTVFEMTISGIERSKCHLHPMKKCVVIFMHQISLIFFYFRLFTNRINHKPK